MTWLIIEPVEVTTMLMPFQGDDPFWEAEDLYYWVSNTVLISQMNSNHKTLGYGG